MHTFSKLDELVTNHLMEGIPGNYANNAAHAIMLVSKYRMRYLTNITITDHMTIITVSRLDSSKTVTLQEHKAQFNDPIASAISKAYLEINDIDYDD